MLDFKFITMRTKIVLMAVIILFMVGCKKPPTTVQDLSLVSGAVYPSTIDQLTSIVATGYANYRSENLNGFQLLTSAFACSEHIADETGPMNVGDPSGKAPYNNASPTDAWITNIWAGFYLGVTDANNTLTAESFYEKNHAVAGDSAMLKAIRGEALFLRAYYYFQLECFYGEKYIDMKQPASSDANILGVPIYTQTPSTLAQTQSPRATARQVWSLIISDLNNAKTLLPNSWSGDNIGRVTSWSAKGLLGKAYVFTQNWDSAKTVLNDVILNGNGPRGLPLQLMPFNIYKQAFNSNVYPGVLNANTDQKFNQESLFEIEVDRVPGNGGYGIFGNAPNLYLTTSIGLFWSPSGFGDDHVSPEVMGYSDLYVHDRNLLRFGFTVPLDSVSVSALVPNQNYNPNSKDSGYISTTFVPSAWYQHVSDSFRNSNGADPRLYVCALEPYMDTVMFSQTGPASDRYKRPVSKCFNVPVPDSYHGWSFKKYQTLDASLNEGTVEQCDGANYYLLRLADIYLLYAEACMNTGDQATALSYINMVHRRAYGQAAPYTTPNNNLTDPAHDYQTLTDATKADPSDVNLAHNPLAYERYAELFAEGHWWFDVCRWGNSTTGTSGNYNTDFGKNEGTYYGNLLPNNLPSQWNNVSSYSYPIPSTEINSNDLVSAQPNGGQNPGY